MSDHFDFVDLASGHSLAIAIIARGPPGWA